MLDRRLENHVRLADADPDTLDGIEAVDDAFRDRTRERFEKKPFLPAEDLAYERGEPPVIHRVLDPVARGRRTTDVDPEVDEEALAEPPLLLQVPVMTEDDQPDQLDRHAVILPRSTAAETASASTVSRTSCARIIHAPRTYAATAAATDAATLPVIALGSPRIFPRVLF